MKGLFAAVTADGTIRIVEAGSCAWSAPCSTARCRRSSTSSTRQRSRHRLLRATGARTPALPLAGRLVRARLARRGGELHAGREPRLCTDRPLRHRRWARALAIQCHGDRGGRDVHRRRIASSPVAAARTRARDRRAARCALRRVRPLHAARAAAAQRGRGDGDCLGRARAAGIHHGRRARRECARRGLSARPRR